MTRILVMYAKISHGLASLNRLVPPLGAPPTYEQPTMASASPTAAPTNRNRWSRMDLASAIGQDPHETDPAIKVWPPQRQRG